MSFNMSSACWDYQDRSQLLGPDPELWDDEDLFERDYEEVEEKEGCCAMGCMECLGLSWSDFI